MSKKLSRKLKEFEKRSREGNEDFIVLDLNLNLGIYYGRNNAGCNNNSCKESKNGGCYNKVCSDSSNNLCMDTNNFCG